MGWPRSPSTTTQQQAERVSTAVNASAAAYNASAAASAERARRNDTRDVDVDSSDSSASGSDDVTVHAVAVTVCKDDLNGSNSEEAVVGVDRLLQYRVHGGVPQYSVRWVGPRADSWEPEDDMSPALVRVFWRGATSRAGKGSDGLRGGKRKKGEYMLT
jgi:hypothetical protein